MYIVESEQEIYFLKLLVWPFFIPVYATGVETQFEQPATRNRSRFPHLRALSPDQTQTCCGEGSAKPSLPRSLTPVLLIGPSNNAVPPGSLPGIRQGGELY